MSSTVCVDASLVVRLLDPTEETEEVERHWLRWIDEGRAVVAPGLIAYEVTNALYRYEHAGYLAPAETQHALDVAAGLGVRMVDDHTLHQEVALLARDLGLPATSDAQYLGVARRCGAEFWTADKRLVRKARGRLDFVRPVGG